MFTDRQVPKHANVIIEDKLSMPRVNPSAYNLWDYLPMDKKVILSFQVFHPFVNNPVMYLSPRALRSR